MIWTLVGTEFGEEEGTSMLCKNVIIWDKVVSRSIPIQASSITEVHGLTFHKKGPQCMDPNGSKTRWHRIQLNIIMLF